MLSPVVQGGVEHQHFDTGDEPGTWIAFRLEPFHTALGELRCRSRRLPSATITDHMSDPIRNLTEGEVEFFGEHGWLHVRGLAAPRFVARLAAKAAVLRGAASTQVVASETAASYKRRGRAAGSEPPRPTSGRRTAACGSSTTSTCTATWAARGSAPTTTCAISVAG